METIPAPACPVCGSAGQIVYRDLPDRLFDATGLWTFKRCEAGCDVFWLDPVPAGQTLNEAYRWYHTHTETRSVDVPSRAGEILRTIYKPIKGGYLQTRLGYRDGVGPRWWRLFAPLAFLHPAGIDAIASDAMFLPAPSTGNRLLEIGCGNGAMLETMQARGWQVEGVEFNPDCVELVKARGLKCYPRDLRELGLPNDVFDAIYMGHVIEHIYEPRSFLQECLRALKPGGHLAMITPNSQSWGHRHYRQDWRGLESPRHLQVFSPSGLRRLTEESGFERCQVRTTNRGAWYVLGMSAATRTARQTNQSQCKLLPMISWSAIAYETFGRLLHLFLRHAGEELILSARKPGTRSS